MNGPVFTRRGKRGEFCKANGVFRPICRRGKWPDATRPAQFGLFQSSENLNLKPEV